jgi:hypothetical protein
MNIPAWSGVSTTEEAARSKMMRIVLATAMAILAMSFDLRPAAAQEGPWCAFITLGEDAAYEDCRYRSLEECQPNVLAGNRGFCNLNPRWTGGSGPAAKPRAHKKRRAQPQ